MEKQLNLVPKLSLNEMALRMVVVNLCYESLSSDMERKGFKPYGSFCFWRGKTVDVKRKISNLVLPETLKRRMMNLVLSIYTEMERWKSFHEKLLNDFWENFDLCVHILDQLYWTCTGIDYLKTAEKILCLEILEIDKRFRLACWYCLEDYITVLWVLLPEEYKGRFNEEINPSSQDGVHLEYYWALILMGKEFNLNNVLPEEFVNESSTYQSYFKYSAHKGSKEATEYFVQKLTDEERNGALYSALYYSLERTTISFFLSGGYGPLRCDVFCYLLSLMTHEQQLRFLEQHPSKCLMPFLEWPCQDLFLDIAGLIWNFLPESEYDNMLNRLMKGIFLRSKGYFLSQFFQDFFLHSPINFKKKFVDHETGFSFLCEFVRLGDEETIQVVWRNIDPEDRLKLLSKYHFFILFRDCIFIKRYLVEMCIGEAMLSKENREMLKEAYMRYHAMSVQSAMPFYENYKEDNFQRLVELLDGTSASTNSTKSSEDETLNKAKRLASNEKRSDLTKRTKTQ